MASRNRIHKSPIRRNLARNYPVPGKPPEVEQNRYAPQLDRKQSDGDEYLDFRDDAAREPRLYNNYDGYDSVYPPSQK